MLSNTISLVKLDRFLITSYSLNVFCVLPQLYLLVIALSAPFVATLADAAAFIRSLSPTPSFIARRASLSRLVNTVVSLVWVGRQPRFAVFARRSIVFIVATAPSLVCMSLLRY